MTTVAQGIEKAAENGNGTTKAIAQATAAPALRILTTDDSPFANLLDTAKFDHLWRVANVFARSRLVPVHYQDKPEDCFIGVQMAIRLKVEPFMFLQNTYVVHGRPGMEAKLAIALINSSGLFEDSLDYEIDGENPNDPKYRVRAFAVRKSTGKRIDGPWIDWALVKAEKWDTKEGSKWRSIPGMMFCYRSATFFGRLHCPERLMGMLTADEVEDIGPPARTVENTAGKPTPSIAAAIKGQTAPPDPTAPVDGADLKEKIDAVREKRGVDATTEPTKPGRKAKTPEARAAEDAKAMGTPILTDEESAGLKYEKPE